jgi:hypothetical protein
MPALPFRQPLAAGLLVVAPLVLSVALPGALSAQTILTISPQQCVWRAGYDPAWAAPNLDESGWQPYANWKLNPAEPRIWIRCHRDLSSLRAVDQPALQVTLYAAYQVFANNRLIGAAGNLENGRFTMNAVHDWPLAPAAAPSSTIALRITRRIDSSVPVGTLPPLQIEAGDEPVLHDRRDALAFNQIRARIVPSVCFSIIGILGLILLGLWMNDRSRHELFLLSLACLSLAPIYLDYFSAAALLAYSATAYFAIWSVFAAINNVARTLFFFSVAGRRVPFLFWILMGLATFAYSVTFAIPLFPAPQALWLDALRSGLVARGSAPVAILECTAPFIALLRWKGLTFRMKPIAALCAVWGATMMAFFALRFTGTQIPGIPDLEARWGILMADVEAVATLCVVVALLALLSREQQETTRERAVLAGEMLAASEIQRMLAPTVIEAAPGFRADVAFRPMREVGGDFYLCRVLCDGRQRVLIGDFSGKGAAAAMAATLLLGAAAARDSDSPANLLAHLSRVLLENHLSGFATCLCADIAPDGLVTFANAGHLPPYRDGREIELESGLPLGIASAIEYSQSALALSPGEFLTFLSDGVVEARNRSGELFGFDRACAISTESAQNIADAAQRFGQEDDITVLTLKLVSAGSEATYPDEPVPAPASV